MSKILIHDPFAEFDNFRAGGFDGVWGRHRHGRRSGSSRTLPVNVYETDAGVGLEAWLPGFSEDEIAVTVDDGQLQIRAERASESAAEDGAGEDRKYRRREVARTVLARRFRLDPAYDATQITARLANGVLELSLPKSEAAAPQRIAIATDEAAT